MNVGDRVNKVFWTRNYVRLRSDIEIVKVNRKTIRAKILSCDGPMFMQGKVKQGEVISLYLPLELKEMMK